MSQSRIAALRAMADQDVSPREAEIARAKLAEMGEPPEPPQPPAPPAAGNYDSPQWQPTRFWFTTNGAAYNDTANVYIRFNTGTGGNW
jgi:hypothetical protein